MVGQARPTTYKGVAMRSRLEAAYAQTLDSRPLEWTYEPQVFADETGQYLPDFQVGGALDCPIFVETKSDTLSSAELISAMRRMHIIRSSLPNACLCIQVGTWRDNQYWFRPRYMCDVYNKSAHCPICTPPRGPAAARAALGSRARQTL